jgi:hypothetical protein
LRRGRVGLRESRAGGLAYLNRVYPIVRKVESDATVMAVKSWVEIVCEHYEQ